ncbi:MAG TPA: hypothetical protein VGC02_02100 [Methanobacterium sp.]
MVEVELKFIGTEQISKQKPFEDSEFLYLTTRTLFGKKLPEIIEELKSWSIDEHEWGDAYFADAREVGDKTYFSLRMTYRSLPPLSKDEGTQLIYDIIESFTVYLNEIEWLEED